MARRKKPEVNTEVLDLSPKKKEKAPAPAPGPKTKVGQPAKQLPLVKLKVFVASSGLRKDQIAGFEAFARINKMGPMSMPDWRKAMDEFFSRPVK